MSEALLVLDVYFENNQESRRKIFLKNYSSSLHDAGEIEDTFTFCKDEVTTISLST
jgi:hypothetical protein